MTALVSTRASTDVGRAIMVVFDDTWGTLVRLTCLQPDAENSAGS